MDTVIKLLPLKEVQAVTTLSKATIYRLVQCGKLAPAIKISERRVAWKESDIASYLNSLAA